MMTPVPAGGYRRSGALATTPYGIPPYGIPPYGLSPYGVPPYGRAPQPVEQPVQGGRVRTTTAAVIGRIARRPGEALQPGGLRRPAAAVRAPRHMGVEPTARDARRQLFAVQAGGESGSYARALHGPILPEVRGAGSAADGREVRGAR